MYSHHPLCSAAYAHRLIESQSVEGEPSGKVCEIADAPASFADTAGLQLTHNYGTFFAHTVMFKVQLLFSKWQLCRFPRLYLSS